MKKDGILTGPDISFSYQQFYGHTAAALDQYEVHSNRHTMIEGEAQPCQTGFLTNSQHPLGVLLLRNAEILNTPLPAAPVLPGVYT